MIIVLALGKSRPDSMIAEQTNTCVLFSRKSTMTFPTLSADLPMPHGHLRFRKRRSPSPTARCGPKNWKKSWSIFSQQDARCWFARRSSRRASMCPAPIRLSSSGPTNSAWRSCYQLRGRVGRSHRALRLPCLPGEKAITPDAKSAGSHRSRNTQAWRGLRARINDLEIRGAGKLLGDHQSGQITAVGFELYTEMMEKAIEELKGGRNFAGSRSGNSPRLSRLIFRITIFPTPISGSISTSVWASLQQQPGVGRIERRDQGSLRAVRLCLLSVIFFS